MGGNSSSKYSHQIHGVAAVFFTVAFGQHIPAGKAVSRPVVRAAADTLRVAALLLSVLVLVTRPVTPLRTH